MHSKLALLALVPLTCLALDPRAYTDPDAYRVYAAILPENRAYTNAVSALIREKTITYSPDCLAPADPYKLPVDEAIADYRRLNRSPLHLQPLFPLDKSYEILPESEFSGPFHVIKNSSRWRQYLLTHNYAGFIELSAVGFNKDKTIAVVYMVNNCGAMCSRGDLIVLQNRHGAWKLLEARGFRCIWVT